MRKPETIDVKCVFCGYTSAIPTAKLDQTTVIYKGGGETVARNVTCRNCERVNTINVPKAWVGSE